jgi:hypothetical protein
MNNIVEQDQVNFDLASINKIFRYSFQIISGVAAGLLMCLTHKPINIDFAGIFL